MDSFIIIAAILSVLILVLIYFYLSRPVSTSTTAADKSTMPPKGTTYQRDNKLPEGWDLDNKTTAIPTPTPTHVGGVCMSGSH